MNTQVNRVAVTYAFPPQNHSQTPPILVDNAIEFNAVNGVIMDSMQDFYHTNRFNLMDLQHFL